ncbi:Alpha/beta hydrolase fold-1 [Macrophomina phaseolina]|uniref:Alpha/beta hydrolase fold-1 n=1 Tax=Macrophomina phaseolina TaxID=35725 RepID=A0ABQ8GVV4_9PEZI|nr:Alpha/beta hydrolase fold-1 [Macrophomina phaseolina]
MMQSRALALSTKPGASLHYSTHPAAPEHGPFSTTLVVFLNGLLLPRSSWTPAAESLISARCRQQRPLPHLLTYDRYGQGDSDPDPADGDPPEPYGHDASAVATDLHRLLLQVCEADLRIALETTALVFVCNSIGCAVARLYAAKHPRRVAAYVFLDSMMANTDFVSLFPDPDADGFDDHTLPAGVDAESLRVARRKYRKMFHPTVPNPEHFDRRNLADLLPDAGSPALPPGPGGKDPYLLIVGHDPEVFAKQSETGTLQVSSAVTNAYVKPAWEAYNQDLIHLLSDPRRVEGPVIAPNCGHFIQNDDPEYVAEELNKLLNRMLDDFGQKQPAATYEQ